MAAPARDRNENQPYDDGGGYGKYRKRQSRRRETTPYDRPPTSIRNPVLQSATGSANGWLSKLVDPAHKLIASGAHKLFASVFHKRLPPPQTQPPEPEAELGGNRKQREALSKDKQVEREPMVSSGVLVGLQGETSRTHDGPSSSSGGGVTDLESMLNQKKFTRQEIDRLTALLQSRVVDLPIANEEKSAVVPSNLLHGNETFPSTPVKENAVGGQLIYNEVLHQDVASPAELAKAYMGSRPSKVSPSMLGLPSQPWKDDYAPPVSQTFHSRGLSTSTSYRSSGLAGSTDNGLITPRSRGRSAVYSMARLPYSRTQPTSLIQGAGTSTYGFGGREFSSLSELEQGRFSGTKQGTLKRRSSVLDNDIGSSSPIRRIRQKSNLLSAAALPVRGTRSNLDAERQLALTSKPASEDEMPKKNGDYSMQITGFTPVSSKSSEMASKILQQLDVLVSSREKSPAKLSPSMLRGQALRSLEKIDSSKFLESAQNLHTNARNAGMLDNDAQRPIPEKEDQIKQNGPIQVDFCGDNVAGKSPENHTSIDAAAANIGIKYAAQTSKPQKPGFRMSADEDFVDIDDEEIAVNTSAGLVAGEAKLISSSAEKAAESATGGVPPVLSGANPVSSSKLGKKDTTALNGTPVVGSNDNFAFTAAPSSPGVIKDAAISSQSDAASDKIPSYNFSHGENASLRSEQNGPAEKAPLFAASNSTSNDAFGMKFGAYSGSQSESSQRMVSVAAAMVDPFAKQAEIDKTAVGIKPGDSFKTSETVPLFAVPSSPAVGMSSFGSGLQNGTLTRPSTGQTEAGNSLSVVLNGSIATDSSVNGVNTGNNSDFAKATFPPLGSSIFKFGSPAASSSVALPSTNAGVGTSQTQIETGMGSSTGAHFIESKPSITSSGSGHFGTAPSTVSGVTTSSPSIDISAKKSNFVSSFGGNGASSASSGISIFTGAAAPSTGNSNSPLGGSTYARTSIGISLFGAAASTSTGNSLSSATASSMSTGTSLFSFSAIPTSSGITTQSQDLNSSLARDQAAPTGLASSTQSTPSQFGSSVSSPFGSTSNATTASASSLFGSSSTSKLFSARASFGAMTSTPASETNTASSSVTSSSTLFGSSWSAPTLPTFGAVSNSSSSSSGFVFGSSASAATSGTSVFGSSASAATSGTSVFGSTNATPSSPFSFSAPAANAPKQPVFGGSNTSLGFGSTPSFGATPSSNSDHMGMEDSMAEDTVQATAPSVPLFGQQTVAPPSSSGFVFGTGAPAGGNPQFGATAPPAGNPQFGSTAPPAGNPQFGTTFLSAGNPQFGSTTPAAGNPLFGSPAASGGNPFQFGGQPNMGAAPQNASPFQASGSVEFNAGGSFSLGTGDKSNRRFVKVRKNTRKK